MQAWTFKTKITPPVSSYIGISRLDDEGLQKGSSVVMPGLIPPKSELLACYGSPHTGNLI
jgi:hypothetical protein